MPNVRQAQAKSPKELATELRVYAVERLTPIKELFDSRYSPQLVVSSIIAQAMRDPLILQCTPSSLIKCAVQCRQMGLMPNAVSGEAYIIPYKNYRKSEEEGRDIYEANLIPGYRGFIKLGWESGKIVSWNACNVYEGDEFSYTLGTNIQINHIPSGADVYGRDKKGRIEGYVRDITHSYAIVHAKDAGGAPPIISVLTAEQILKRKETAKYNNPVWQSHRDEMYLKTPCRSVAKLLPQTPELIRATTMETLAEESLSDVDFPSLGVQAEQSVPVIGTNEAIELGSKENLSVETSRTEETAARLLSRSRR